VRVRFPPITISGSYAYVTDGSGGLYIIKNDLIICIDPKISNLSITNIDTSTISASSDIIDFGNSTPTQHGFGLAMETDSVLVFNDIFLGKPDSIGTFNSVIGSLTPNSTYYLYAFISNDNNNTMYTDTVSFRTYGLPSVSILSVNDIDSVSITASGRIDNIGNPGITQHGFCWSKDINPTIQDHSADLGAVDSLIVFNSNINSLEQSTQYYIRVFATNEVGTVYSDAVSLTTLETAINSLPDEFTLDQNYPNPFNPTTTLQYGLPETSNMTLNIFDIAGRKIKQWNITNQQPGWHEVIWDGTDMNGNTVSTGVYIYSLQAGDFIDTKKMVFMK